MYCAGEREASSQERRVERRETNLIPGMFILDTPLDAPRRDQLTLQVTLRSEACGGNVRDDHQHCGESSRTFAFRLCFRAYPGLDRSYAEGPVRGRRRGSGQVTTFVLTSVSLFSFSLSAINTPAMVSRPWVPIQRRYARPIKSLPFL